MRCGVRSDPVTGAGGIAERYGPGPGLADHEDEGRSDS